MRLNWKKYNVNTKTCMKTAHMFYFIFTGKNNLKDIYYCNIDAISYSKSKKKIDSTEGGVFLGNKK